QRGLLTELREVVRREDQGKFDALMFPSYPQHLADDSLLSRQCPRRSSMTRRNGRRRRRKEEEEVEDGDMEEDTTREKEIPFSKIEGRSGSPMRYSRKVPGAVGDTRADYLLDDPRMEELEAVEREVMIKDGEGTKARAAALCINREEIIDSRDVEGRQQSSRMTSGRLCDSKLNARPLDEREGHITHFRKNPYEERTAMQENQEVMAYENHYKQSAHRQEGRSVLASSGLSATTTTSTITSQHMSPTSTGNIPISSTAYRIPSVKEKKDHRADGAAKDIEMTEMKSPSAHFLTNSSQAHMTHVADMLSPTKSFPQTTATSTLFNTQVEFHLHQDSDHHLKNFGLLHSQDSVPKNQAREHLMQRGRSIPRKDLDRSLDRERTPQYPHSSRDQSLHSLDRYPSHSMTTSSADLITTTKTFPSDPHLHLHQSSYPYHRLSREEIARLLVENAAFGTQRSTFRDLSLLSMPLNLTRFPRADDHNPLYDKAYEENFTDTTFLTKHEELNHKHKDFKAALNRLRTSIDLGSASMKDHQAINPQYSLLSLNQSLQDLRPENKTIGSHRGCRFLPRNSMSRSVSRLFPKTGIGEYFSCDQLLSRVSRDNLDEDLISLYNLEKLAKEEDTEHHSSEGEFEGDLEESAEKWFSIDDCHYSSTEELLRRGYYRQEAPRMIRRLLGHKFGLADIRDVIADSDIGRIIDKHTKSYEDEYRRRIDKDRMIDQEIRRLEEDIRKVDELHKLRAEKSDYSDPRMMMDDEGATGIEGLSGETNTAHESRCRSRKQSYSCRDITSVSPCRCASLTRAQRT
ncbi:hypothetical protein FHG87_016722, partial [Trinorchestia longiramus]